MKFAYFALLAIVAKQSAPIKEVRGGATLSVSYPPDVISALGSKDIPVSLGNFGHIQYGSTIHASLVRPLNNTKACDTFETFFGKNSIVLVDAGDCPITTKVRHIE
jgi:ribosomal protein L14